MSFTGNRRTAAVAAAWGRSVMSRCRCGVPSTLAPPVPPSLIPTVPRPSGAAAVPSALRCLSSATDHLVSRIRDKATSEFARGAIGQSSLPSDSEPGTKPPLIDFPTLTIPDLDESDFMIDGLETIDVSAFDGVDHTDPFLLVKSDMTGLTGGIKRLLGVDHPVLSTVAKYFFENDGGKKVRPVMVLLMSYATNQEPAIQPAQHRLAEITEMIHTASLLHDDVIDMADTRRGVSSVNTVFGNKLAVLAGDFLLARASVSLARLRNVEVVELLSTVIEDLVRGEIMQIKHAFEGNASTNSVFDVYLKKSYYKTASLMANSCTAVTLLAGHSEETGHAAYMFGKHVGIAFQLVDDILDFEGSIQSLGKPALNDLKQGLATAPVLFASYDHPRLLKLMSRKFEVSGDVETACDLVKASAGIERSRRLANAHAQRALDALLVLEPSPHRTALAALVAKVVDRTR